MPVFYTIAGSCATQRPGHDTRSAQGGWGWDCQNFFFLQTVLLFQCSKIHQACFLGFCLSFLSLQPTKLGQKHKKTRLDEFEVWRRCRILVMSFHGRPGSGWSRTGIPQLEMLDLHQTAHLIFSGLFAPIFHLTVLARPNMHLPLIFFFQIRKSQVFPPASGFWPSKWSRRQSPKWDSRHGQQQKSQLLSGNSQPEKRTTKRCFGQFPCHVADNF